MADLVRRHVAVIATPSNTTASIAAKAATSTIPIVFGAPGDPVKLGLVASLARPGGNTTGFNSFTVELVAKRLALLHELVPKAVRVAALLNPANLGTEVNLLEVQDAARVIGLQIHVLNASTSREIDAAFAALQRERPDALFVAPDQFFFSRRVPLATIPMVIVLLAAIFTVHVLKERGKLDLLKGIITPEGGTDLAAAGLVGSDFDTIPFLMMNGDYRPMAFREGNYAAVAAMNASLTRKVGPALVVSGEDPRFEGKFNGHTHMGMLGSTALAQFDVFLDWAEKNIPNPIVKTSCTKRPARGP
jgi:hypothetical protein